MKYLVVGDVDQIQSYVFASSRLRAIRGASALLETAVKKFVQDETSRGVNCFRWHGGQVIATLDVTLPDEADEFCARLEESVRRESKGEASITTACVEYDGTEFQKKLKQAFRCVHTEKDGRQTFGPANAALVTNPYYRRCSLLPTQPASSHTVVGEVGDQEGRYLSNAAAARWEAVKYIEFDEELLKRLGVSDCKLPYQIDDLWEQEEGGYMGFIAADGNSIGQMLEVIPNEGLYHDFSNAMYELLLEAISKAASDAGIRRFKFGKRKKTKRGDGQRVAKYLPLIPVIVAGDDLSLLVRAEHALPLAEKLCQRFAELSKGYDPIQQVINLFCRDESYRAAARQIFPQRFANGELKSESDQTWDECQPLTLSVGVAIAKHNFPISVYRRLAAELRDEAKQRSRQRGPRAQTGGMIDFAVITTATAQSLESLRSHYQTDAATKLTMRPYTLGGMQNLRGLAQSLKELPRSKRKFLYTELFAGATPGQVAYEFVMGREREGTRRSVFDAMERLGCSQRQAFHQVDEEKKDTPLIDALEMAELLKEDEN